MNIAARMRTRTCKSGQINLCPERNVLGVSCDDYRRHGAFAEYVKVPEHIDQGETVNVDTRTGEFLGRA